MLESEIEPRYSVFSIIATVDLGEKKNMIQFKDKIKEICKVKQKDRVGK